MELTALQTELMRAANVVLSQAHWGMPKALFVASVLAAVPSDLKLLDVDIAAGSPEVHETPKAIAAAMPDSGVPAVLVLQFGRSPEHAPAWREFAALLATLAAAMHLRVMSSDAASTRPTDDADGAAGEGFVSWLLERNAALERELDRVRAMVRFLVETAQRQLGD